MSAQPNKGNLKPSRLIQSFLIPNRSRRRLHSLRLLPPAAAPPSRFSLPPAVPPFRFSPPPLHPWRNSTMISSASSPTTFRAWPIATTLPMCARSGGRRSRSRCQALRCRASCRGCFFRPTTQRRASAASSAATMVAPSGTRSRAHKGLAILDRTKAPGCSLPAIRSAAMV